MSFNSSRQLVDRNTYDPDIDTCSDHKASETMSVWIYSILLCNGQLFCCEYSMKQVFV